MNIILDVKKIIASFNQETWIKLVLYDEEFNHYARTKDGIDKFVEYFHIVYNDNTFLFGELHSINDKYALINNHGDKYWYYHGKEHRENDLPIIMDKNIVIVHRVDNDKDDTVRVSVENLNKLIHLSFDL